MKIGIDLDGVCYDFKENLVRYLEHIGVAQYFDIPPGHNATWNMHEDWGMSLEKFLKYCNDGADAEFVFCGGYMDHTPESIQRIKDMGHEIHIITDRKFGSSPDVAVCNTFNWLHQWNIPYDSVTFSSDKTSVKTDIMVEDKLQNYDALEAVGTCAILVNRPWNYVEGDWKRIRTTSIDTFADFIEGVTILREKRNLV